MRESDSNHCSTLGFSQGLRYRVSIKGIQHAQTFENGRLLTGNFGKLYDHYAFSAPEIDSDFDHDARVDLWSLGAIFYTVLCGTPLFTEHGDQLIIQKLTGRITVPIVKPSEDAQSLVRSLLRVNPDDRMSLTQVLDHPWMNAPDSKLRRHKLNITKGIFEHWNAL